MAKKNSAFMKPVKLSKDLEAVVGKGPMPRTKVVKNIWAYIKENDRQDPKNKRMIIPDGNLAKIFDTKKPVDMFQMTKLLSNHITP